MIHENRPKQLNTIIIFLICTLSGTIFLWILDFTGILKNVLLADFTRAQYWGFLACDLFALPLLLISIIGLSKMKFWGYIATQIEMGTWIYSSVGSFVMAFLKENKDIFVLLWSPVYIVVAVYVIVYTWKIRESFK